LRDAIIRLYKRAIMKFGNNEDFPSSDQNFSEGTLL